MFTYEYRKLKQYNSLSQEGKKHILLFGTDMHSLCNSLSDRISRFLFWYICHQTIISFGFLLVIKGMLASALHLEYWIPNEDQFWVSILY